MTTQRPLLSASCDNPRDKNALLEAGISFFVLSTFDAFAQFYVPGSDGLHVSLQPSYSLRRINSENIFFVNN